MVFQEQLAKIENAAMTAVFKIQNGAFIKKTLQVFNSIQNFQTEIVRQYDEKIKQIPENLSFSANSFLIASFFIFPSRSTFSVSVIA